jgi:hypothetical protein
LLDVHEYNGQLAPKAAGLHEKVLGLIHPAAEAQRTADDERPDRVINAQIAH